jgi:Lrp/AsnC family leucine-responsive transcriptional regulator
MLAPVAGCACSSGAGVGGVAAGRRQVVSMATNVPAHDQKLLLKSSAPALLAENPSAMNQADGIKLDRLDLDILAALQADARISLNELSQRVGLTSSPCWTRIRRMEQAGVIQGYTVRVNSQAVGLGETVIVQVTLDSHSDEALLEFGRALAAIPEVVEAFLVSGDYDYYLRIAVSDTRDYERLLRERLYKIPGIRHSKSSFVLRSLKQADLPLRR